MVIDLILLVFAIAGFWLGYTKGIAATLFSILSYVVALVITLASSPWLSGLLITQFNMNHLLALILGTLVFFIVSILLFKWLGKKVENFLKKGKRNRLNKILGGMVMLVAGIIFYSLILWLINHYSLLREKDKMASKTYDMLEVIPQKAKYAGLEFKTLFSRYWELMQVSAQKNKPETPE